MASDSAQTAVATVASQCTVQVGVVIAQTGEPRNQLLARYPLVDELSHVYTVISADQRWKWRLGIRHERCQTRYDYILVVFKDSEHQ